MDPEDVRARMRKARTHLNFSMQIYRNQLSRGKDFLHEHPLGASSWREGSVETLAKDPRVDTVVGDLCRYDLKISGSDGVARPIQKSTRWMSSSPEMLDRLKKRCDKSHQHGSLLDGKAKHAAIWPHELCIEILKGMRDAAYARDIKDEIDREAKTENMIKSMSVGPYGTDEITQALEDGTRRGPRGAGDGGYFLLLDGANVTSLEVHRPEGFSPAPPRVSGTGE